MNRCYSKTKRIGIIFLFFFIEVSALAQDKIVKLSSDMFTGNQEIQLAPLDGWIFKKGNDIDWSKADLPTTDWKNFSPAQLSTDMVDKNGKVEGWFRLKVNLDSSFKNMQLGIRFYCWAATDLYIDGEYIKSGGNMCSQLCLRSFSFLC